MPSLAELEDDLTLQYVLLDTLEPSTPDYDERKANIEQTINEIDNQIQALTSPLASPSALESAPEPQHRKRARDEDEYLGTPHRGSKSQRMGANAFGDFLSSDGLPDDLSELLGPDMNAGRSRQMLQSAMERSKQREQAMERQRQQTLQDEEFARQLSQSSQPNASSSNSFNRPANLHGPNLAQRNLNPDGTLRSAVPSSTFQLNDQFPLDSSRSSIQPSPTVSRFPVRFGETTGPQYGNAPHISMPNTMPSFSASVSNTPNVHSPSPMPMVKPEPSAGNGVLTWNTTGNSVHQPYQFSGQALSSPRMSLGSDMPGAFTVSDDSDSSLEEISPEDFKPNPRAMQQVTEQRLPYRNHPPPAQVVHQRAPQSSSANTIIIGDGPSRQLPWHQGYAGINGPMRPPGPRLPGPRLPGPVPAGSATSLIGQAGAAFRDALARTVSAVQGLPQHVAASIPNMSSGMSEQMRRTMDSHSYLYADSSRSEEDIKKLLENIRPDEDLPPELRKGTPDDMSIALLEHQKLGLSWLVKNEEKMKGGILADDMGLGKTIQAIALMVSRKSEDPRRKTNLIVAPVALLRQWESEIEEKLKKRAALSVFRYHGNNKKPPFQRLRDYDVVLTTYGSLTSEYKKLVEWMHLKKNDPNAKHKPLSLLGENCKWYRVILDEAQNIKNKNALCSKAAHQIDATYRICMTGTPMMNSVEELYPLLRFCRFKPYDAWERFNQDIFLKIKSANKIGNDNGMRQLQTVIRATMLRRTKKSKLDGKPLITLPERTSEDSEVTFTAEEETFYRELQHKAQATVRNMISKGTLGKKYGCALVLLLRLRQACCHQHLVFFSESVATMSRLDCPPEAMIGLAKELKPDVISRLKAEDGAFDCPICLDGTENPAILLPCGHWVCLDCFTNLKDSTSIDTEGSNMKCPVCRGPVDPNRGYTDYQAFKQVHQPELFDEEERQKNAQLGLDVDSDESESESEEEDESETEDDSLGGFIVPDDFNENDDEGSESAARSSSKKSKKKNSINNFLSKSSSKSKKLDKGKGKDKAYYKNKSLAELKKEGQSSKAARKIYYKRLHKWYVPSAKIARTIELLDQIALEKPGEKTLIFSQFTSFLDLVEVGLQREDRWKVERYDGSMSADHRAAAVDRFRRDPSITVMLISLKAGNAGLNLNFASQVILEDPFYNPFVMDQAIDRAHRIGQRCDVNVHYITVPGTVEDRILELCQEKRELIEKALDETEGKKVGRLGTRELAYLFGLDLQGRTLPANSRPPNTAEASRAGTLTVSNTGASTYSIAGPSSSRLTAPVRPPSTQNAMPSMQSRPVPRPPVVASHAVHRRPPPPASPSPMSYHQPSIQHVPTINPALLARLPSSPSHNRSVSVSSTDSYSSGY